MLQHKGIPLCSCLFRIVDSFGTEPAFNHRVFAKQNKILTSWGGQDLNPRQFFTMFREYTLTARPCVLRGWLEQAMMPERHMASLILFHFHDIHGRSRSTELPTFDQ